MSKDNKTQNFRDIEKKSKISNTYTPLKQIAKGGWGEVWLSSVNNDSTVDSSQIVATKQIRFRDGCKSDHKQDCFHQEYKIASSLKHPYIMDTKELSYLDPNDKYSAIIPMEYCENGCQHTYIGQDFGERTARYFFGQMVEALKYCHSQNVIHFDLKPLNMMLGKNFDIKMGDFGVSEYKSAYNGGKFSGWKGTPRYAPPELLDRCDSYFGEPVDVFCLGYTLLEMVIHNVNILGNRRNKSTKNNLYQWFNNDPKSYWEEVLKAFEDLGMFNHKKYCNPDFQDLMTQMLMKDPSKRITLEQITKHPWYLNTVPESQEKVIEQFEDFKKGELRYAYYQYKFEKQIKNPLEQKEKELEEQKEKELEEQKEKEQKQKEIEQQKHEEIEKQKKIKCEEHRKKVEEIKNKEKAEENRKEIIKEQRKIILREQRKVSGDEQIKISDREQTMISDQQQIKCMVNKKKAYVPKNKKNEMQNEINFQVEDIAYFFDDYSIYRSYDSMHFDYDWSMYIESTPYMSKDLSYEKVNFTIEEGGFQFISSRKLGVKFTIEQGGFQFVSPNEQMSVDSAANNTQINNEISDNKPFVQDIIDNTENYSLHFPQLQRETEAIKQNDVHTKFLANCIAKKSTKQTGLLFISSNEQLSVDSAANNTQINNEIPDNQPFVQGILDNTENYSLNFPQLQRETEAIKQKDVPKNFGDLYNKIIKEIDWALGLQNQVNDFELEQK